jgi:P27 family predicted phage terminase small subunit
MGRPQVADNIHVLKGTAPEPRKRETETTTAAVGVRPPCPRHIQGTARKAWLEVVRLLEKRGTLDEAAGPTLIVYATTMARFLEAKADVEKNGMMVEITKATSKGDLYTTVIENPMLAIQVDAEAQLLQITKSLGISPDAREKVLRVKPVAKANAVPLWLAKLQGKDKA